MTTPSRLFLSAAACALVSLSLSRAQTAPTPPPASASAPAPAPAGEVVELSPFTVNTSRDLGYQAENTLAGSRLNARLRDTPGSVAVFTKEFIEDLAITDVKGLVEYSVSSEMDSQARNAGTGQNAFINAQNLNGNVLTRGISASQGMDYFPSIAPIDAYRAGRFDDSRGPNSILFGIGSVGGIINQSSKIAVTHSHGATLRFSRGSWDRQRAEIDFNRVLLRDRLALSVAAVHQEYGGWRQFDYQDKQRVFATVVYRPTRRVTFTAMGETGRDRTAVMRSGIEAEEMLAWHDHRAARGAEAVTVAPTTALPTAAQIALGITTRNGTSGGQNRRAIYIENDGVMFDAIGTYLTGTYNNAAVRAPDGTAGRTGGTLRLSDPRFYPYSNNAAGPGMNRTQGLSNYTLTADWQATPNLYLNFGHNYQRTRALVNLMVGASPVLRGDPNRTLGLGGPANPWAGRLYFDGDWRRDVRFRDYRETRLSASYTLAPRRQWLGRHRIVGLVAVSEDYDERANSWLVLAGRPFNADALNANNRVTVRNYLTEGDQRTYRVGDWRRLPATLTFGGRTFQTAYANDAAGGGTNGGAIQENRSGLAVVQSHFLRDRLVATFGFRQDEATILELGYRDDPIRGAVVDPDPAKRKGYEFTGRTHTGGLVLHVLDWLSLIANRSTNVGVPSFNRTVFPAGTLAGPPEGKGADYGLGLDLLGGRLNAKLVHFESSERGSTGAYGATASFNNRNVRVMDAFATALVGAGLPYTQAQWDALRRAYVPPVSGSLADFDSKGYEARITANLRPNWRLVANYSYNDSARSQLYGEAIAWYGLKAGTAAPVQQGVTQNAAGQFVVNASAFESAGTVAKWIEFAGQRPGAALGTLTTSTGVTVAQEIFNLVEEVNAEKQDQEKRWGLRPHKVSLFTAYDFKEGRLRGFTLGGGWRWRSQNVIGTDATGREITGRALTGADLMLRYATKFARLPGRVSFQVNLTNVLDNDDPIPVRLLTADGYQLPGGRGTAYGRLDLVEPREVRFTTTYSF
jgi:outer membrane receptor for ferric coprogen and ferric-rhodotorulic acid